LDPTKGGPIEGLRQTARLHALAGHETDVVTIDPPEADFLNAEGFRAHGLGPGKYGWAFSKALRPWLIEHIHRFDAIILHGLWLYPSIATARVVAMRRSMDRDARRQESAVARGEGRRAQRGELPADQSPLLTPKKTSPRFLVFPHGMLDPWFQSWRRRPFKTARNYLYWKLVERQVIETSDAVLFTSEEERQLARTTFRPYRPNKEIVVPYGTSAPPDESTAMREAFGTTCPTLGPSKPYLLFLSRVHEKKGVDLLIQAYQQCVQHAEGDELNAVPDLVIAGPGLESPYGQKLLSLCQKLGFSYSIPDKSIPPSDLRPPTSKPAVYFCGMLQGDAKWGAYYGCEAFILPSHQENFGIVVAEALACAKPVMISDQINIWREVDAAGAGFIAEDTISGTTLLLNRWLNTPEEERARMSTAGHELFHRCFNVEKSARAILGLARKNTACSCRPRGR